MLITQAWGQRECNDEIKFTCGDWEVIRSKKGAFYIQHVGGRLFVLTTPFLGPFLSFDSVSDSVYEDRLVVRVRVNEFHIMRDIGEQAVYQCHNGEPMSVFMGSKNFGDRIEIKSNRGVFSHFRTVNNTPIIYKLSDNSRRYIEFDRSAVCDEKTVTLRVTSGKITFSRENNREIQAEKKVAA